MEIFLIILSCVLFLCAIVALPTRIAVAPALSYLGMLALSFARDQAGIPVLPINTTILTAWFVMTLVVTIIIMLEPEPVRRQTRGMGYISIGAFTGMAVGLLAFTVTANITFLYSLMILCTAAGIFLGFLLYSRTPDGSPVGIGSGNFFRYLLAKGFPTAITVMQIGVALVLIIAVNTIAQ